MIIGDTRKYLTCFITLKEDPPLSGKLDNITKQLLSDHGAPASTVAEARKNEKLRKIIS